MKDVHPFLCYFHSIVAVGIVCEQWLTLPDLMLRYSFQLWNTDLLQYNSSLVSYFEFGFFIPRVLVVLGEKVLVEVCRILVFDDDFLSYLLIWFFHQELLFL